MKTIQLIFGILFLVAQINIASAQTEFTKQYEKTFSSNNNSVVELSNKYGDITIKDWNKSEVSIKVIILVENGTEKCAKEVFEKIDIQLIQVENKIMGTTEINSSINIGSMCSNRAAKFRINYEVNMPKDLRTNIYNKYGGIFINELTNLVFIDLKYGNIQVNKLSRGKEEEKNTILLAYSDARIGEANWLKLDVSYSKVDVENAYALMILSKYSKWDIGTARSIVATSKYDSQFNVEEVNNLVITEGKYAQYTIEKLGRYAEIDLKYSSCEIEELNPQFEALKVATTYGKFEVSMPENTEFQFEGTASYGEIDVNLTKTSEYRRENTSLYMKGYAGKNASTEKLIEVEAKYANIEINN